MTWGLRGGGKGRLPMAQKVDKMKSDLATKASDLRSKKMQLEALQVSETLCNDLERAYTFFEETFQSLNSTSEVEEKTLAEVDAWLEWGKEREELAKSSLATVARMKKRKLAESAKPAVPEVKAEAEEEEEDASAEESEE